MANGGASCARRAAVVSDVFGQRFDASARRIFEGRRLMNVSGNFACFGRLSAIALIQTFAVVVLAQSTTKSVAFDVASVKLNAAGANDSSISRSGGRIALTNVSLRETIFFAYGIAWGRDYELSGPGWLDAEKFDMVATCPPDTSSDRVREMLQTLLAERFGLKTHFMNRKLESYALIVDKRGPKLPAESTVSDGAFIFGEDHMTARGITMAGLASRLSGPVFKLDRPVVDITGIKGAYDFTLNWAPDGVPVDWRSSPSIFTALQEQLGLRLVARKIAFRILVVDHAEKVPSGN